MMKAYLIDKNRRMTLAEIEGGPAPKEVRIELSGRCLLSPEVVPPGPKTFVLESLTDIAVYYEENYWR